MKKISELFSDFFKSIRPEFVTEECKKHLNDALVGKTIERIVQIPTDRGWFIIFLLFTDSTSIHFCYPNLDGQGIRVQIDKLDGTKLHLPEIPKG